MNNHNTVFDPSLFTKPPPNYIKNESGNWNNFKIPPLPRNGTKKTNNTVDKKEHFPVAPQRAPRKVSNHSTGSGQSKKYTQYPSLHPIPYPSFRNNTNKSSQASSRSYVNSNQQNSKNYQKPSTSNSSMSNPPPNYKSQMAENASQNIGVNSVPFKPNVPPPNMHNSPYSRNLKANPLALQAQAQALSAGQYDEASTSYFMPVWYGYPVAESKYPYTAAPLPPSQPNYPPPQQPPLPLDAPPQIPPPPPTSVQNGYTMDSSMANMPMQNHMNHPVEPSQRPMQNQQTPMANYQAGMSPYLVYNNNTPFIQNHYGVTRKYEGNCDQKKNLKKKKKPLSQVVPQRREWSIEDAKKALDAEKECNKRTRRQGLIIKFPDQEVNRDIVTSFHTGIESVHFQQPSTPRYCFVTLTESADPETVIKQLNQIKFGLGYLHAEIKKDREDEQGIRPTDIDPLTLYVGNLAQEITKEDMTKTYPKQKRIDIGYAKKMKYTRYAFVSFYNVTDAIEAFKTTHSSQMYSKSLIVRFRRLHGTVGMPGEVRVQTSRQSRLSETDSLTETESLPSPWDIDVSSWDNNLPAPDAVDDDDDDDDQDEGCVTKESIPCIEEDRKPVVSQPSFSGYVRIKKEIQTSSTTSPTINCDEFEDMSDNESSSGYGENDDQTSDPQTPEPTEQPTVEAPECANPVIKSEFKMDSSEKGKSRYRVVATKMSLKRTATVTPGRCPAVIKQEINDSQNAPLDNFNTNESAVPEDNSNSNSTATDHLTDDLSTTDLITTDLTANSCVSPNADDNTPATPNADTCGEDEWNASTSVNVKTELELPPETVNKPPVNEDEDDLGGDDDDGDEGDAAITSLNSLLLNAKRGGNI
ncbi:unnamed protein product [Phyllotreta striolata]|uniref:RRM domain-containing protein n=1 Tax=Phyllotreta striolata TaxID=444603 RepID=A0A9N9TYT3_PHYSR|nr:unnamed protein product [Phyllotreta striolata]